MARMEHMPVTVLLFYSIPESIVLISLSAALYGYNVKSNFKRICLLSVVLALITYLVRALPVTVGENVLIQLPFFIVLTAYFLRISVKRSLVVIITGFVFISIAEYIAGLLVMKITGMELNQIINNFWPRLLIGWVTLLILIIPTVIIVKKHYSLASAVEFLNTTTLNTKITLMIFIVLFQALLAGSLHLISLYGKYSVWPVSFDNDILQRMIGIALILIPLVSIFLLKRLFALSQQEAITSTQEAFIGSLNNLFVTIRGQRHDFVNHIQVIYSLLKSAKTEEAIQYLDHLLDDIQDVNEVIKTKDPALSALLNAKIAVAQRHNIVFETAVETSLENLKIKSLDLVKILGNLLDNAIEAVMNQPPQFKKVKLIIKKYHNLFVFEVINPRPIIPSEHLDNLFQGGFSTKKDSGHSGLGLAVVKEITEKYKGRYGVKSNEKDGTSFTIAIPE